ncbi:MAG: DUF4189 domain-containing protein [Ancalomicrobiaceae bacterium]|nr:DUF4189 domain-containing protein [Ancalomicrobiaceae bacterium]
MAHADWAIAIGRTGSEHWASGTAWNYSSASQARRKALANCRSQGPNCEIIAQDSGQCVALAFGKKDNAYAWAQRDTKSEARRAARQACEDKYSNGDCEISETFCDE